MENWIVLESKEISSYPSYPSYIFKVSNLNLNTLEKLLLKHFKDQIMFMSYDNYELKISFNELFYQEQLLFKIIHER